MNRRNAIQKAAMLLGGTFSAPTLLAMQNWESKISPKGFTINFTASQSQIIAEVAEMILPQTNTLGAKAAGVPAFIEMMLKDCYYEPEHLSFKEGLEALEKTNFSSQNEQKRTETLKKVEADNKELMKAYQVQQSKMGDNDDKELMKVQAKGLPFWRLMKELTLLGYFTSEEGIKASFDCVPIPRKLEVIKLKPNQKVFAYQNL